MLAGAGQRAWPGTEAEGNGSWYERSFFLLHLDHHTNPGMEVGRAADPVETARLLALVKPDVIQIHAKGNPGWTTYPSKTGHTPPKLARDVMQVWTDLARDQGYVFSAYFNLGRDREIMQRKPAWNRVRADGSPYDNMLCYHSGVAEQYLWPMIEEIQERYRPGGFWFDGSCFTVMNCWCAKCRERFRREQQLEAPTGPQQPGWKAYKDMQRQIYREFCVQTIERIKRRDPACLVAINWAYSLRMPEEPPAGVDFLTGDHGVHVENLAPDAIWYDGQSRPFDLMTTVFTGSGREPKPAVQIQQEMAIILSQGGRYFAWDNPTAESGLVESRYQAMARHVRPFLRQRQPWCVHSRRVPDVSLFHGAEAHYDLNEKSPTGFPRFNPPLLAACQRLRQLHLTPEMVSGPRLERGEVRGRLLLLEDITVLTEAQRLGLRQFLDRGGKALLTGKASPAAGFPISPPESHRLMRTAWGQGTLFQLAQPLFGPEESGSLAASEALLREVLPLESRHLVCHGPDTVEAVLREQGQNLVLHLVNVAPGKREVAAEAPAALRDIIRELPAAPACHIRLHVPTRPAGVELQPQGVPLHGWTWAGGWLELEAPGFDVHQIVVVKAPQP